MLEGEEHISTWELLSTSGVDPGDEFSQELVRVRAVLLEAHAAKRPYLPLPGRRPLWELLSSLDGPFKKVLSTCQDRVVQLLTDELHVSQLGAYAPNYRVLSKAWLAAENEGWDGSFEPFLINRRRRIAWGSDTDRQLSNLRAWDDNLRFAVRRLAGATPDSDVTRTLECVRQLIRCIEPLFATTLYEQVRDAQKYGGGNDEELTAAFCELCWRLTMFAAGEAPSARSERQTPSKRFCRNHDPKDTASDYRNDLRYKAAFQREVRALSGSGSSNYTFKVPIPKGASRQARRLAAYKLVHARLRRVHTGQDQEPGACERILSLLHQGLSQAEVARELKISRQAVSRAVTRLSQTLSEIADCDWKA